MSSSLDESACPANKPEALFAVVDCGTAGVGFAFGFAFSCDVTAALNISSSSSLSWNRLCLSDDFNLLFDLTSVSSDSKLFIESDLLLAFGTVGGVT